MRTCPSCHTEITENGARFCPNCGAPLASPQNSASGNDAFRQSDDFFEKQPSGQSANQPFGQPNGQSRSGYTPWGQPSYQGQQRYSGGAGSAPQPSSGLAIGALICSFLFTILGLILGIMGLNRYPKGNGSRTMCVVAVVISALRIGFYIIYLIAAIAGVANYAF